MTSTFPRFLAGGFVFNGGFLLQSFCTTSHERTSIFLAAKQAGATDQRANELGSSERRSWRLSGTPEERERAHMLCVAEEVREQVLGTKVWHVRSLRTIHLTYSGRCSSTQEEAFSGQGEPNHAYIQSPCLI